MEGLRSVATYVLLIVGVLGVAAFLRDAIHLGAFSAGPGLIAAGGLYGAWLLER